MGRFVEFSAGPVKIFLVRDRLIGNDLIVETSRRPGECVVIHVSRDL